MKSFQDLWEDIHSNQAWGKYPSENVVRFVARNYYSKDRSNVKILDFGCGAGANTWYLSREGFDTYAFDGSKSAVANAEKLLSADNLKAEFRVRDALNLDYGKEEFDCIIDNASSCSNKLEYIQIMYHEMYSMLKEGGKLFSCIFTTNTTGYGTGDEIEKNTFVNMTEGNLVNRGITHFYDEGEIQNILGEIGFKEIIVKKMYLEDKGVVEQFIVQATK